MENCFKTQLKESVNNNTLIPLGAFRIKVNGNASLQLDIIAHIDVKIVGNGYFSDSTYTANNGISGNTRELGSTLYIVTNDGCYLDIIDNYSTVTGITTLTDNFEIDITPLKYGRNSIFQKINTGGKNTFITGALTDVGLLSACTHFNISRATRLGIQPQDDVEIDLAIFNGSTILRVVDLRMCSKTRGNVSNLSGSSLLHFLVTNCQVNGNISNFASMSDMRSLNAGNTSLTGTISSLNNVTKLTTLAINDTTIGGNLESMVAAWYNAASNPRRSETLNFTSNGIVTLDGSITLVNNTLYTVTFSDSGIVIKRGSTTLATYDGSNWS